MLDTGRKEVNILLKQYWHLAVFEKGGGNYEKIYIVHITGIGPGILVGLRHSA